MTDRGGKTRSRRPTPAEAALFRKAMKDVTPLADRPAEPDAGEARPRPLKDALRRRALPTSAEPAGQPTIPKMLPELRAGVPVGVDARTMDRLKRGRFRPEARLDLHGMTQDRAQASLRDFVLAAHRDGRRGVIVITGKGGVSAGGGVLRREVPRWLNMSPLREVVLGFSEAMPKDGGAGALYVLIKRRRPTG